MKHSYFGDFDASSGLWKFDSVRLGSEVPEVWLLDCTVDDLDWLQSKFSSHVELFRRCKELYYSNYFEAFHFMFETWRQEQPDLVKLIFGKIDNATEIDHVISWPAFQLSKIVLIRDDSGLEFSMDYRLKNVNSDYVANFRFDDADCLISCGWES